MKGIRVDQIMTTEVHCMRPQESISAAYELMIHRDLRHIPVIDHQETLVGIISDRDILVESTTTIEDQLRPMETVVSEIMNTQVITCLESDSLFKAIELMLDHRIHSIPIVNSKQHVVGLVTTTDIMRLVLHADFDENMRKILIDKLT